MKRVAVFGLAITGTAVAKAMVSRGIDVVLSDDVITKDHEALASELHCSILKVDTSSAIEKFLADVDVLLPAPGVAPHHPVLVAAIKAGISIRTEIDIAYEWEQQRVGGPRPILGITGTDGKTTTTMLVSALLRGAGMRVAEVGNTDIPFVAAIDDDVDVFVVECSSFRLQFTEMFRCQASAWLNFAPDHLDWHINMDSYAAAKARIWKYATTNDVAVAQVSNEIITKAAVQSSARLVTFGFQSGDYRVEDEVLVCPHGPIARVDELWRSMPHDITNALAACAVVVESGLCGVGQLRESLVHFESAPHRIELVGCFDGAQWFDDSKATSPHAAMTAICAFESVVLIAGGRNKDLDLSAMAIEPQRMRGVVAIGDDAPLIASAFSGICDVQVASSMQEAVAIAAVMSHGEFPVLLSPGCTSYDWYNNYNERGDHFQECVRLHFSEGVSRV